MSFSYHTEQWLHHPIEAVFAFFADPDNLPALMPSWQQARIEKASIVPPPDPVAAAGSPAVAGRGTQIALTFLPFLHSPLRVRWEAEITEFSWNGQFCDRQVHGPFAFWYHCHRLRAIDRGGIDMTLIVDHVEYELPYGPLGKLAHRLFVRRQIEAVFAYRQSQLAKIFAQVMPESQPPQPKSATRRTTATAPPSADRPAL